MSERLPPEECEDCGGSGWRDKETFDENFYIVTVLERCRCEGT